MITHDSCIKSCDSYLLFLEGQLLREGGNLLLSFCHVEGGQTAGLRRHLLHAPLQIIPLPLFALKVGSQDSVCALLLIQPAQRVGLSWEA